MSTTITPQQLASLRAQGTPIELIDVRTPAEFREIHVDFARNVPLDRLDPASWRGRRTMSLERQVRIAAGSLVLVGAVLALVVHPYFAALSALVGAGLIFAGVTDTCGMALLLARMPWNQVAGPTRGESCSAPAGSGSCRA